MPSGFNQEMVPMRRRYRPTSFALTCALLALQASIARAQQPTDTAAAAPPADTTVRKTLGDLPVYLTGYVTTSYIYDFGNTGDRITGRFYDRFHDTFIPNALRLGIEKLAATDKVDIGVRFELLFGTDAEVTQALVDDGTFNLGRYGDLTEAYITVNAPLGDENHYVQFKAGKMWTLMGFEVIDDVLDPNLSVGNQFTYLENFTNMGVGADFKLGPKFDAQLRLINGWDVVEDNNSNKSLMARLGWTPGPAFTLGVLGYWGPEKTDNDEDTRQGFEALATFKGLS
ncbi:MAG: outer membrane beta-barrel protein, partial [Gemmatimonadales bacterium]